MTDAGDHDRVLASLVPWYANDTLDGADRLRLESHLPGCESCQELLVHAELSVDVGRSLSPAELEEDHVDARLLVRRQDAPGALPEDATVRIDEHLRRCAVCRDVTAILADLAASPVDSIPGRADPPDRRRGGSWAGLLPRLLGPGPALAYLSLLVLVLTWQMSQGRRAGSGIAEPLAPATRLPGDLTFRDDTAPSEQPHVVEVPLRGAPPHAFLELLTDLDPGDVAIPHVLEILEGGVPVWRWEPGPGDFDLRGDLRLRLDGARLSPGREYEVRLRREAAGRTGDGIVVYRRSFRLIPPPPP